MIARVSLEIALRKEFDYLIPAELAGQVDVGSRVQVPFGPRKVMGCVTALAEESGFAKLKPILKVIGAQTLVTPRVLELVRNNPDLAGNLSAAAHLIHGSSEGRFNITYCPGHLTRQEVENVNFRYASLPEMLERYNPARLRDGYNEMDGESVFYISNPALGLWAYGGRFHQ